MSKKKMLGFVAIAMTVILIVAFFSKIDNFGRDLTTNHASLDAQSDDPQLRPQRLLHPKKEVADRLRRWVDGQPRWQIVAERDTDNQIDLHLTRTTPLLRFVDDIRVQLADAETGTEMHAESRSRIGKGDLGQNPRNLKEIVAAVQSP